MESFHKFIHCFFHQEAVCSVDHCRHVKSNIPSLPTWQPPAQGLPSKLLDETGKLLTFLFSFVYLSMDVLKKDEKNAVTQKASKISKTIENGVACLGPRVLRMATLFMHMTYEVHTLPVE